jgi:hypothetical protein
MTLLARLYVTVDILIKCGKHLRDRTISVRVKVRIHISRLTCICALGVTILPLSTIFLFGFGTVWYFVFILFLFTDVRCAAGIGQLFQFPNNRLDYISMLGVL